MMKNWQSSRQVLDSVLGYYMSNNYVTEFTVGNYYTSSFLYQLCIQLVLRIGMFRWAMKKYRAEYHQHNSES